MTLLTPKKIVKELNRYIIGQENAKKAVAVALRNRWRRRQVQGSIRDEILPKNILMIGPTGVGKTEIARRIAKLSGSPFVKVEATKFTEVGYVGRDVESIIRDLMDIAINLVRDEMRAVVKKKATQAAEERIINALVGSTASDDTREKFRKKLHSKSIDDNEIEIELLDSGSPMTSFDLPGGNAHMGVLNIGDLLSKAMGGKMKSKKMTVADAYKIVLTEESDKLIDEEKTIRHALDLVENDGIVFIDEIDKITARSDVKGGEVSREGVQRDLLPLLEGTTVSTKYGMVKTDHILFITSGAFHMAKPSDLLPELQGRLPIRVELKALTLEDMISILKEPESSLLKQYTALMAVEKVTLEFTESGIKEIAKVAIEANRQVENIGARRLHTIMEKILEEISFNASDLPNEKVTVSSEYVKSHLGDQILKSDLAKFIL